MRGILKVFCVGLILMGLIVVARAQSQWPLLTEERQGYADFVTTQLALRYGLQVMGPERNLTAAQYRELEDGLVDFLGLIHDNIEALPPWIGLITWHELPGIVESLIGCHRRGVQNVPLSLPPELKNVVSIGCVKLPESLHQRVAKTKRNQPFLMFGLRDHPWRQNTVRARFYLGDGILTPARWVKLPSPETALSQRR
jgi:hypothetical protein